MRLMALVVGVAAAIGLLMLGAVFGLNGQQWAWWGWAAWAGAGLVLTAAVVRSTFRVTLTSGGARSARLAGGLFGAALVTASVLVMAHRYSDPYSGALFWPHTLAIIAFIGLALVVVSIALSTGHPDRRT
jgi:hypothetical protein